MRTLGSLFVLLSILVAPALQGQGAKPDRRAIEDTSSSAATVRFRVACFNAWSLPLVSQQLSKRMARLPGALTALKPQVVCLQEMWSSAHRKRLVKQLGEGWHHTESPGGLLVLSRFPIEKTRSVRFPKVEGLSLEERLARKGFLEVILKTPVGRLRVVDSHLALRDPGGRQLRFLTDSLRRLDDLPLILAADLNVTATRGKHFRPGYAALRKQGLTDTDPPKKRADGVFLQRSVTRVGWPRPPGKGAPGWHPDYILFRSAEGGRLEQLAFRLALDTQATALSDHNLLLADFRLTTR